MIRKGFMISFVCVNEAIKIKFKFKDINKRGELFRLRGKDPFNPLLHSAIKEQHLAKILDFEIRRDRGKNFYEHRTVSQENRIHATKG